MKSTNLPSDIYIIVRNHFKEIKLIIIPRFIYRCFAKTISFTENISFFYAIGVFKVILLNNFNFF